MSSGRTRSDGVVALSWEEAGEPEERFRLIVESIKDYAIFMLDVTGHVLTWNPGAERIKGYSASEIVGRPMSTFYRPEDVADGKPQRLLSTAVSEGRVEDEGWRVRKDGTRFWADVTITAIRDQGGKLRGFAKVTRDLTEARLAEDALRASEHRFRLLIDSIKDYAIFQLDVAGNVASWNSGAQRIKGYTTTEIVGQHFSKFYPPEDVAFGKPAIALETARQHGRYEDEGWRMRKDGTRFWASVVVSAIRDETGTLLGYSKVTRDLTERQRSEQERLRLAQAQEAIRLRDEFLSIASHELRTPLTAMQLHLHSLRARIAALDQGLAERLGRANRSTARLAELVDTLLDVSRISTGKLELHPKEQNLSDAVNDVLERMSDAATTAGCSLESRIAPDLVMTFDALRIEQVLTNLLSNAFKYAAGTPVEVTLEAQPDGDGAILQVKDHGPGVPEEALQRIFGRFERASSMSHFGGLGLGLYVSREIVRGHGGVIEATNAPSGGAVFTVKLPRTPPRR